MVFFLEQLVATFNFISVNGIDKAKNRILAMNFILFSHKLKKRFSLWKPRLLLLVVNRNRLCNISSTYDTRREISSLGNENTKLGTAPRRFYSTSYLHRRTS